METREFAEATVASNGARPSLLRVLADSGVAGEDELRLAFAEAMGTGERFGEVVLRRGWLNDEELAEALAQQRGLPHVVEAEVDQDAVRLLGGSGVAAELGACPIQSDDGSLLVAVADPSEERFTAVRAAIAAEPDFAVVTAAVLERLVGRAAELADSAERAAAEARASRAAEYEQHDAPLRWLDQELEATTAQLIGLRGRVGELVALDERRQRELSDCRAQIAQLEAELANRNERIAVARQKLAEAGAGLEG